MDHRRINEESLGATDAARFSVPRGARTSFKVTLALSSSARRRKRGGRVAQQSGGRRAASAAAADLNLAADQDPSQEQKMSGKKVTSKILST